MKAILSIRDIKSLRSYIRMKFNNGYSEFSIKSNITIGKINSVLNGKSSNKETIKNICDFLEVDYKDIDEWKNL